jgi:hypothetical protein
LSDAKPAADAPEDEADLVRASVYFMAFLLLGLIGVTAILISQRDTKRAAVDAASESAPKLAQTYDQVRKLLAKYKEGGAGQARYETQTWMSERYTSARIDHGQVSIGEWRNRPQKEYEENSLQVTIKGVSRVQAVQFVWNVERVSTIMRTIEMKLTRSGGRDDVEADKWDLVVTFGYRVPKGFKESS